MGKTTHVSVDSAGNQGNGGSGQAAVGVNGRFVAFSSDAFNLVPNDTNNLPDVFVHDRRTGNTTRISVAGLDNQANSGSFEPALSADGQYVAFVSEATNLVPNDTNGRADVFVRQISSFAIIDSFTAPDGTDLDGWTPDTLDNDSEWEVVKGDARIRDKALALSRSGPKAVALLNAGNVIREIEFDFTLGGDNAFWFYPLRVGRDETPRSGYGFWVNQRHFDFKKFTDGKEKAVRDIRFDFETQSTYTARFVVSDKRLSLYLKKAGGAYGADLLNLSDPDYRYLTYLGFASNALRNEALRIDNVRVAVDSSVRDRDGDGVADPGDAYPGDPDEWADSDGDGVGDKGDAFPNDPAEWADSDGDGIGNNADPFPTIAAQLSLMTGCDLNGDGKDDILWCHQRTGDNVLWQMNGAVRQAARDIGQVADPNWKMVGAADFSGDGLDDILWHHARTGGVVVWQMNGFVLESVRSLGVVPDPRWRIVGVGDFNADTKNDILWRNSTSGSAFVWQMNGLQRLSARVIPRVEDPDWKVVPVGN